MKIELSEDHIYRVNGVIKPGVNEILQSEGIIPDFDRFNNGAYKRQLGSYTHAAIRLYFENRLDLNSLQGEVKDYFQGFLKFLEENPINPLEVEKSLYSEKWDFCGTPDCWTHKLLYDWKVGQIYPYYSLTTGAYLILLEEAGYLIEKVNLVCLSPNDYRIKLIKPDKQTFLAALVLYQWRKTKRSA